MLPETPPESQEPLSEKYRPKTYQEVIGQDSAVSEIKSFLQEFPKKKKALILHGPAGTGKTSLVQVAAKEANSEILELNSSDLRNRAKLEETLKPATEQQSLFKQSKILLMDEVDGVTGTDIGGVPELVRVIQTTKYPIIMTCNDVWQSKLSPVRAKSKLVEMKPLPERTIVSILDKVSKKEGIQENPHFLNQIAIKSQGDVRAALNDLQAYSAGKDIMTIDTQETRDMEENIFNILRRLFKEREPFLDLFESSELSLDEIFLWIEENLPKEYQGQALVKAYHALSKADVFRGRIYRNQSWRFLIYQNAFQSAGISFAKSQPLAGFTRYERPKRILKIWLHNRKVAKKKSIAKKYAHFTHYASKRALQDFPLLLPTLQNPEVQQKLKLSDEEIAFLNQTK
tara:strand:+ start:5998 stop:7197 length:1200 start_codon:yes stop_codon:yes gene_type:complete